MPPTEHFRIAILACLLLAACDPDVETGPAPTSNALVAGNASVESAAAPPVGEINGPQVGADGIVRVARGERLGFSALGHDGDGDLLGAEWYLDGSYLGAQYRSTLPGATGQRALFWRGINFPVSGERHQVRLLPFDKAGNYGDAVQWDIEVHRRPRLLYVDRTDARLASAAGIARLASFVERHGFNQVALYSLHKVLPSETLRARLPLLLRAVRAAGVERVFAIVASVDSLREVGDYLDDAAHAAPTDRFDGLVTEFEFWHDETTWPEYMTLLAQMRSLADRDDLLVATYLGWFDDWHAGAIAGLADVLFLHAYVPEPGRAFGYIEERLERLARHWSRPVHVWPIFSGERHERDAGHGPSFMGAWLHDRRGADPLDLAEDIALRDFRDAGDSYRNGVRISGFAWFAARHLEAELADD